MVGQEIYWQIQQYIYNWLPPKKWIWMEIKVQFKAYMGLIQSASTPMQVTLAIINQWIWAGTKIQLSVLDNKKCTVWSVWSKCLVFLPVFCLCLCSICVCFVSVCPVRLSVWFLFLSSLSSCLVVLSVFLSVCLVFSDLSVYLSVCLLFLSICLSLWCVCLSGLSWFFVCLSGLSSLGVSLVYMICLVL